MNRHKTKFQKNWLSQEDVNKHIVSSWATQINSDVYSCYCKICECKFSISKGFCHMNQHASSEKHQKNLFKLSSQQSVLVTTSQPSSRNQSKLGPSKLGNSAPNLVKVFNERDAATRIELFWTMETVNSNNSTNSCEGKKDLFTVMFPGSVPASLSLSPSKASYLITDALGPYFKNLLVQELTKPNVYFTLQYDETSNVKHKKELQIRVNYWSNS